MNKTPGLTSKEQLVLDVANFVDDPLGFVYFAFLWGEGDLTDHKGPDEWQKEVLEEIGLAIGSGDREAFQAAVASGHGIGKGALSSWIIIWAMATKPHLNGVVTANTKVQLETKTWRELAVWHKRCLVKDWFEWTATKFYNVDHHETWFTAAIPWSEKNPEAFAGQHGEHVLIIYDEASAIPDIIWEVSEGAMTTPGAMRLAFGNPTRNTGKFRECFGKFKHRWLFWQIDSRDCRMTDKRKLDEWVEDYGIDSDFVKVRVRGEFPSASSMQFIPSDIVEVAQGREARTLSHEPLIIGVDVARFGDDQSVICFRRGRDAVTIPWKKYRGLDTMQLASRITEAVAEFQPEAVFVDGGGVGGGVVDRLRSLHVSVIEVNFGTKPGDGRYFNKRAEMWGRIKEWLPGGAIPEDRDLYDDLIGVEYGYTITNKIQLEKKEDMKKRGLASPDFGDALALTFAYPVATKRIETGPSEAAKARREYNPLNRNRK
jgi:hypothetical protein